MSKKTRYRFTRLLGGVWAVRGWARLFVVFWFFAIGLGFVLAGVALFTEEWRQGVTGPQAALERGAVVGFLIMSGFLAGSPFVVFGQLLNIFLDQRTLLARIHRLLRRRAEPRERSDAHRLDRGA